MENSKKSFDKEDQRSLLVSLFKEAILVTTAVEEVRINKPALKETVISGQLTDK